MPQSSSTWAQRKAFDNRQKGQKTKVSRQMRQKTTASAASRRPFFVYGTLLPGFRNYQILDGRCAFQDPLESASPPPSAAPRAAINGFHMVHYRAGFPGVKSVDRGDGRVYGRLVWATGSSAMRIETLRRLDALELYFGEKDPRNQYARVLMHVELCSEGEGAAVTQTLEAWVYVSLIATAVENETAVLHGDWARFVAETGVATAADDWHAKMVERDAAIDSERSATSSTASAAAAAGAPASTPQSKHSAWLLQTREAPLDAKRAIVDAHHHLWQGHPTRHAVRDYMLDAVAAEIDASGHNIVASVYIQR